MDEFERKMTEFSRRGDTEKVKWLKLMERKIMPSQIKRIQQNDKAVLKELVLPKWVNWDFLYVWANSKKDTEGRRCIFCGEMAECGIDFKEKFICENCFLKLKNLNQ